MKSKRQVKEYIKSQEWYNSFVEELEKHMRMDVDSYLREIVCKDSSNLLIGAFLWECTPQGVKYWGKIEKEYFKWLFS